MVPLEMLATVAATSMVTAMAKDSWEQTKRTIVAKWRERHPAQDENQVLLPELELSRAQLMTAPVDERSEIETELTDRWRARFEAELERDREAQMWLRELVDSLAERRSIASLHHSGSGDNISAHTVTINKEPRPPSSGGAL